MSIFPKITAILISFLVVVFSFNTALVAQQSCTELLSEAEEAYRNGRFNDIQQICPCLAKVSRRRAGQTPVSILKLVTQLREYEEEYAHLLGSYRQFSTILENNALFKEDRENCFSNDERLRAYLLLGKMYETLGAIKIAELFSKRIIVEYPAFYLEGPEHFSYKQIYDRKLRKTQKFALGATAGWGYALPRPGKTNRAVAPEYSFKLTEGNVLLGLYIDYLIRKNFAVSIQLWQHTNQFEYTEPSFTDVNEFNFFHKERRIWLKMPLLVKLSHPDLRWLDAMDNLDARFFVQGGFSFNFLSSADATIIDAQKNLFLNDVNVIDGRHKLNYDLILGLGSRFRVGQSFVTAGVNYSYGLRDVVNQDMVGNPENPLFRDYGVIENNYKTHSIFYFITYEMRFNFLN